LLETLMVPRCALLPVPVQGLRLPPRAAALPADRRKGIPEVHRLQRFVAVGPGAAQGQRGALAIDAQVPLAAFLAALPGVCAGNAPPQAPRTLWVSTQQGSEAMPFSCPTRGRRACQSCFQTPWRCQ